MAAKHAITGGARGHRWLTAAVAGLALGAAACGGDQGGTKEAQAKQQTRVAGTPAAPARAVRPASDSATLPPEPVGEVTREVTYKEAEGVFRKGDYAQASRPLRGLHGAEAGERVGPLHARARGVEGR